MRNIVIYRSSICGTKELGESGDEDTDESWFLILSL